MNHRSSRKSTKTNQKPQALAFPVPNQAHARVATVPKLNVSRNKRHKDLISRLTTGARLVVLPQIDRGHANTGSLRQLLLSPLEKSPSGSNVLAGEIHRGRFFLHELALRDS